MNNNNDNNKIKILISYHHRHYKEITLQHRVRPLFSMPSVRERNEPSPQLHEASAIIIPMRRKQAQRG